MLVARSPAALGVASAAPVVDSEGTIFVPGTDGFVHAVTPDGAARWAPVRYMGVNARSVVVGQGRRLYVTTKDNTPVIQAFGEID